MSLITIEFKNWEKFNPRSDRANFTWLRLQNCFFSDQKIFGLTHEQVVLYLFLLCEASKKNNGKIEIKLLYISALLNCDVDKISSNINILQDAHLLVSSRHQVVSSRQRVDAPRTVCSLATDERTNERTNNVEQDKKPKNANAFDHESISTILEYLNIKANKNYSNKSKANNEHIKARLNEGYELDDFKLVIDNKCRDWLGTDMEKYLRPVTLFNASKFDGYRNDSPLPEEKTLDEKLVAYFENPENFS